MRIYRAKVAHFQYVKRLRKSLRWKVRQFNILMSYVNRAIAIKLRF